MFNGIAFFFIIYFFILFLKIFMPGMFSNVSFTRILSVYGAIELRFWSWLWKNRIQIIKFCCQFCLAKHLSAETLNCTRTLRTNNKCNMCVVSYFNVRHTQKFVFRFIKKIYIYLAPLACLVSSEKSEKHFYFVWPKCN